MGKNLNFPLTLHWSIEREFSDVMGNGQNSLKFLQGAENGSRDRYKRM